MDYLDIKHPESSFHASFKPYLSGYTRGFKDTLPFKSISDRRFLVPRRFFSASKLTWESTGLLNATYLSSTSKSAYEWGYGSEHALLVKSNLAFVLNWNTTYSQLYSMGDSSWILLNQTSSSGTIMKRDRLKNTVLSENYQGYVSYNPGNSPYFNLQAGKGKHVVGDGYRSLLHSDHAPAYPYAQISAKAWRLQYHIWYAALKHQSPLDPAFLMNKYGVFHYLSYKGPKGFQLGFFESVIWAGSDSLRKRSWDPSYLNPVVFFRPLEYHNGSPDNVLMGLNSSAVLYNFCKVYAQFALDEFLLKKMFSGSHWWGNKYAWQLGLKGYINRHWFLQAEYNYVRPFTYSHLYTAQNYAHAGYALAHPQGSNLKEAVLQGVYRYKSFAFALQYVNRNQGTETLQENLGNALFKSYASRTREDNFITASENARNTQVAQTSWGILLLPHNNIWLKFSLWATQVYEKQKVTNFGTQISLSTGIWNQPVFPISQ